MRASVRGARRITGDPASVCRGRHVACWKTGRGGELGRRPVYLRSVRTRRSGGFADLAKRESGRVRRDRFHHLPDAVASPLRGYARRLTAYRLAGGVALAACVYLLAALAVMHADRFAFLSVAVRRGLAWSCHALLLLLLAGVVWRAVLRRPSSRETAYRLEGVLPADADERFTTLDALLSDATPAPAPGGGDGLAEVRAGLLRQLEEIGRASCRERVYHPV